MDEHLTTEQKGQIALGKVIQEVGKKGIGAYLPVTQSRYDLILDYGDRLLRAQVKYADAKLRNAEGAVMLHLRRRGKCYTADEVDVLLVYLPRLDKVAWFGPEVFHNRAGLSLRLLPAKNGQKKGFRMIQEFLW
jgi:PD-(D/E)XK endonuclease